MLKNLKQLHRRSPRFQLPGYSSLVVLDKTLVKAARKIELQLHFECKLFFSTENKGPEVINENAEKEKIWTSPQPLAFNNGEMKLYSAQTSKHMLAANLAIFGLLGSISIFGGSKLYDYENRSWFSALFYFGMTTSALRGIFSVMRASKLVVIEANLLDDGKHFKISTRRLGLQPQWETVEIKKIKILPQSQLGVGFVFLVDEIMYILPAVGAEIPRPDVLSAVLDGYNIDTSTSQEEIVINN